MDSLVGQAKIVWYVKLIVCMLIYFRTMMIVKENYMDKSFELVSS